jgi:hypothetical protein
MMPRFKQRTLCFALAFGTLLPQVSSAEQDGFDGDEGIAETETGPELGVRAGYGAARGKTSARMTFQQRISGALPIALDLGYRLKPRWFIGGYGEYAVGLPSETAGSACPDCTYTWLHLSLMVQYRLLLSEDSDLWLGLGAGRQWFNSTLDTEAKLTQGFSGPEYLNVQFGGSWFPSDGIAVGPYSAMSIGAMTEGIELCGEALLCPLQRRELNLGSPGAHVWFSTGLRIAFLP